MKLTETESSLYYLKVGLLLLLSPISFHMIYSKRNNADGRKQNLKYILEQYFMEWKNAAFIHDQSLDGTQEKLNI